MFSQFTSLQTYIQLLKHLLKPAAIVRFMKFFELRLYTATKTSICDWRTL